MLLPILVCISSFVSQADARVLGAEANRRGYDAEIVFPGERTTGCDVLVLRGDTDLTYPGLVTFDDHSAPLRYRYQALTRAKAHDLFAAWGQYEEATLLRKAIAIGLCEAEESCMDGWSTVYDLFAEEQSAISAGEF